MQVQKFRGPHPEEIGGQKHAKFGAISDNFRLRSRRSPERVKISKIGKRTDRERFLPRSTKKSGELWSTNYRELDVSMYPPKLNFLADYILARVPYWIVIFFRNTTTDDYNIMIKYRINYLIRERKVHMFFNFSTKIISLHTMPQTPQHDTSGFSDMKKKTKVRLEI